MAKKSEGAGKLNVAGVSEKVIVTNEQYSKFTDAVNRRMAEVSRDFYSKERQSRKDASNIVLTS